MLADKLPKRAYDVRLINKAKGLDITLKVNPGEYILDAAEIANVPLPVSCRAGACVTCTAKVARGQVYQDHIFLKRKEEDAGFLLTCKSYPLSDCVILTHQEDALLDL